MAASAGGDKGACPDSALWEARPRSTLRGFHEHNAARGYGLAFYHVPVTAKTKAAAEAASSGYCAPPAWSS